MAGLGLAVVCSQSSAVPPPPDRANLATAPIKVTGKVSAIQSRQVPIGDCAAMDDVVFEVEVSRETNRLHGRLPWYAINRAQFRAWRLVDLCQRSFPTGPQRETWGYGTIQMGRTVTVYAQGNDPVAFSAISVEPAASDTTDER
jgi:hypothetical protein